MLNLLRSFNVIIKPHPACPIELDDLDSIDHKFQNTDLGDLILSANIVFTGNVSSAAVEAYSMGKLVISARNLEDLDMSPLRGAKDVKFVSDSVSLEGVLRKALRNAKNQKNLELFNLNSDLTLWKKVLDV
jgi:surface carbohydrate biosynthesis protein (TIGR04326 family)